MPKSIMLLRKWASIRPATAGMAAQHGRQSDRRKCSHHPAVGSDRTDSTMSSEDAPTGASRSPQNADLMRPLHNRHDHRFNMPTAPMMMAIAEVIHDMARIKRDSVVEVTDSSAALGLDHFGTQRPLGR